MGIIKQSKIRDVLIKIKGDDTFTEMAKKLEINKFYLAHITAEEKIMSSVVFKKIIRIYNPDLDTLNELVSIIFKQINQKARNNYLQ